MSTTSSSEMSSACSLLQVVCGVHRIFTEQLLGVFNSSNTALTSVSGGYLRMINAVSRGHAEDRTCRIKCSGGLLQLCVGQSLLVVQKTGAEERAGQAALLKSWSLWQGYTVGKGQVYSCLEGSLHCFGSRLSLLIAGREHMMAVGQWDSSV